MIQQMPLATEFPVNTGRVLTVNSNEEFDVAVKSALPGSQILLSSSVRFGPLVIPDAKVGLTIGPTGETVAVESRLGGPDLLEQPALTIGIHCSDIIIERLNFCSTNESREEIQYTLVRCGYTADNRREARTASELPNRIAFLSCSFTGTENGNTRIGLVGNARHLTVRHCTFVDIHEVREDSQGILINNTPGPVHIEGCYIEAAGENILLGGAVPSIPGVQLGDLTCINNVLAKPLSWKQGPWACKNLFELKGCARGYIARNRMTGNWPSAQDGTAVLFTVRDGSQISDILFENNVVSNVASGILITPTDDLGETLEHQITNRITLRRNLWLVGFHEGAGGRVYDLNSFDGRPIGSLTIDGDRWVHAGPTKRSCILFQGLPHSVGHFTMKNCMGTAGDYGIIGAGTAIGSESLLKFTRTAELSGNVFIGADQLAYTNYSSVNHFIP